MLHSEYERALSEDSPEKSSGNYQTFVFLHLESGLECV